MATAKNGNASAKKQNNAETVIQQHLNEMREFGRNAKAGSTAKQNAIELFQKDCLDGIANIGMVDRYVAAYCEGASITGNARAAFQSAMSCFGDPNVIKVWPTLSATLTKLHDSKDKDTKKLVSRETTGKDKFGQLYAAAKKIRDLQGAVPAINEGWITKAVAKVEKSKDDLAKLARKAIADSMPTLLPAKPTPAQLKARDEFFKVFGIELPKQA
jgi:hypothetical protein